MSFSIEAVEKQLQKADCVCFDVDSTISKEEAIDVLAEYIGVGKEVSEFTKKAMEGGVTFQEALKARLELMKPTRSIVEKLLEEHNFVLTEGVKDFIDELKLQKKNVFLISGGFKDLIIPISEELGISPDHIYANILKFRKNGDYEGFDENQPTSKSGGKPIAIQDIKNKFNAKHVIMIGDGATDLEARSVADYFIGYGGVCLRKIVKEKSDFFTEDWNILTKILRKSRNKNK